MTILVTGVAGFIGYHVANALLDAGEAVLGVDNMSSYYNPRLKEARVNTLSAYPDFTFLRLDLSQQESLEALREKCTDVTHVVHLAAQPGIRYSLQDPYAYVQANVAGHLTILELCRGLNGLKHLVFASSSSVYGGNEKLPFAVEERVDRPVSLYAATKRADELMSYSYAHLFNIPMTGLRFFTVYGPWGRPDMAVWQFTDAILSGRQITLYNHGDMRRDFTYIDDVVSGVLGAMEKPPSSTPPYALYNIGNSRSESLKDFVAVLEKACGKKADIAYQPMQPGDVKDTYADISATTRDFGFMPKTPITEGLPKFVEWYKEYFGII